ncbi:MAG: class I SAM-dependent methyltransferase [Bacilli bacterium]|nr:class I SAM-dependent methyltransferase [Bacilli bacterium]
MLKVSNHWQDYECIDAGNGEKLERWGNIILRRPDPQAMWETKIDSAWSNIDGHYHRSSKGGGYWDFKTQLPEYWTVKYEDLTFKVTPTNFKHTGLFPEQATNWEFMMNKIKKANRKIKVLNLFAYTGAATMACAKSGAEVVQVDASKGMTKWAKENMQLCNLEDHQIRFIVDDCLKFVEREHRRGHKYDAIVMDPPSYGRGPNKEVWKFEKNIAVLLEACLKILSDKPLFLLINSYTTGVSNIVLGNMLKTSMLPLYPNGKIETGEVGLQVTKNNLILPCGIYGRWESND